MLGTGIQSAKEKPVGGASPKLPPSLIECYKQYKLDSERLAAWLGETAKSLGFQFAPNAVQRTKLDPNDDTAAAATPSEVNPTSGGGRLKGKARKQAATAAAQPRQPGSDGGGTSTPASGEQCPTISEVVTTTMTSSQFIQLARFIADSTNPPVFVPYRIIDWACRAIHYRRHCSNWFRSNSSDAKTTQATQKEQSDRSHEHFIAVLEQVVAILAPRVGSRGRTATPPSSGSAGAESSGVELLQSRFAALALDDHALDTEASDSGNDDANDGWDAVYSLVEEGLCNEPSTPRNGKAGASRAGSKPDKSAKKVYRVKHKVEANEDEALMAYLDFLMLLNFTRSHIQRLWHRYIAGEVSLEAAGLYTSIAVDRMQAEYDTIVDLCPLIKTNHYKYSVRLFEILCSDQGKPSWEPRKNGQVKVFFQESWEEAQLTLVSLVETLHPILPLLHRYVHPFEWFDVGRWHPDWPKEQHAQVFKWFYSLHELINEYHGLFLVAPVIFFLHSLEDITHKTLRSIRTSRVASPAEIPLMDLYILRVYLAIGEVFDQDSLTLPETNDRRTLGLNSSRQAQIIDDCAVACKQHAYALQQMLAVQATLPTKRRATLDLDSDIKSMLAQTMLVMAGEPAIASLDKWECTESHAHLKRLLPKNPWLAGLHLAYVRKRTSLTSSHLIDDWGCVRAGVYMYQLMELLGLDGGHVGKTSTCWPLMEDLIHKLIGPDKMFVGRTPTDLRSLWTNLTLTYGPTARRVRSATARHGDRWELAELFYGSSRLSFADAPLWARLLRQKLGPNGSESVTPKYLSRWLDLALLWRSQFHPRDPVPSGVRSRRGPYPVAEFVARYGENVQEYCEEQLGFNCLLLHVQAVRALNMLVERAWPRVARWADGKAKRSAKGPVTKMELEDQLLAVVWQLVRLFGEDDAVLRAKGVAEPVRERRWAIDVVKEFRAFVMDMVRMDSEAMTK